jgi:hypothetical protein
MALTASDIPQIQVDYVNLFILLNKYTCMQVRPIEILTGHPEILPPDFPWN